MIDYFALIKHLPVILTVTAILALLVGVPYEIEKAISRTEQERDP